jgi:hypothetical protein
MQNRLWLFSLILAVPIIAYGVAAGVQAHFNSDLRAAIRQQYPDAAPEKVASLTVDLLCNDPNTDMRDLCDTNANLNLMRNTALGSAGAGLVLLLTIYLGGVSARNSRKLLLVLIRK